MGNNNVVLSFQNSEIKQQNHKCGETYLLKCWNSWNYSLSCSFKGLFFLLLLFAQLSFTHIKDKNTVLSAAFPSISYGCSQQHSCSIDKPRKGLHMYCTSTHRYRAFSGMRWLSKQMKPVYREVLKTFNMLLSAYSLYSASMSVSAEPSLTHYRLLRGCEISDLVCLTHCCLLSASSQAVLPGLSADGY